MHEKERRVYPKAMTGNGGYVDTAAEAKIARPPPRLCPANPF